MFKEAVKDDAGQDLSCYGQQGDAPVVVTRLTVAFPFVDVDYAGIFQLLRYLPCIPYRLKEFS